MAAWKQVAAQRGRLEVDVLTCDVTEKNDLYIGADGSLALARELNAAMNTCEQFARASRNEMIHKMDLGMPFWPVVFGESANLAQFESAFRARMREIPEVIGVTQFNARIVDNELQYEATIETIYGTGAVTSG